MTSLHETRGSSLPTWRRNAGSSTALSPRSEVCTLATERCSRSTRRCGTVLATNWNTGRNTVDGRPMAAQRLVAGVSWCVATAPEHLSSPSLLWGDARLGNVMFDDSGSVEALLDWELATIGPAEMDLGWYLALDQLTNLYVRERVPGFRRRSGVIAEYERALGRKVEHLEWHEIFALVRSIAINDRQARLAARAGTKYPGIAGDENPVLDVLEQRIARFEHR